jgi:hypothetical protein
MKIITIDFETYYDKEYSLSKMTTEAYVRSSRFEIIGMGIKEGDDKTKFIPSGVLKDFLAGIDFSDKAILCHNTAFDGAILSWLYGVKPKLWLDTLSMARPLHQSTVGGSLKALVNYYDLGEKGDEVINALGKHADDFDPHAWTAYANYCINDVELTYKLFKKLVKGFPVSELMVIDQTLRMYTEPVIELDQPLLIGHLLEVKQRKSDLIKDMNLEGVSEATMTKALMSNNIFAKFLKNLGVDPPTKISLRTGKETWAFGKTDKAFLELQNHPDERVQTAVAARLGVKSTIEETRTQGLIDVSKRGRLPIMLNYYGAHTGRFSGGDKLNLQNLPARGNNKIRQALKAPAGHKIIACDSSQIEARMVAYIAGQDGLVQAFREGRDVYSEFASEVYGRKITKTDKVERFVGKTCILGLGYGMGAEKFRNTLEIGQAGISVKIDLHEADRIVRLYRQKNFKITQLWNLCGQALNGICAGSSGNITPQLPYDSEGIILPNGLRIKYPALRKSESGFVYIADAREYRKIIQSRVKGEPVNINWTKIYGGKVTENVVQALARIVIAEQMAAIGQHYHVAFQVHDEIIITAPEAEAEDAEKLLVEIMSTPPDWAKDLPVACESGLADNYGDT